MLTATLSLRGLYEYDKTIFDLLALPEGIDKEILTGVILFSAGAREVLYPDPDVLKSAIGYWSRSLQSNWTKLLFTTTVEYDPISNYDRTEIWTDVRESQRGAEQNTTSANTNTAETAESIKAYNDTAFSESNKVNSSGEDSTTVNGSVQETLAENVTRNGRTFGNIGVTTTQQMLQSEREVAAFNIYEHIAAEFCYKFLLGVY